MDKSLNTYRDGIRALITAHRKKDQKSFNLIAIGLLGAMAHHLDLAGENLPGPDVLNTTFGGDKPPEPKKWGFGGVNPRDPSNDN